MLFSVLLNYSFNKVDYLLVPFIINVQAFKCYVKSSLNNNFSVIIINSELQIYKQINNTSDLDELYNEIRNINSSVNILITKNKIVTLDKVLQIVPRNIIKQIRSGERCGI